MSALPRKRLECCVAANDAMGQNRKYPVLFDRLVGAQQDQPRHISNAAKVTDLGAWREMSDLLVKLPHDAKVHRDADGLDVCRFERAANDRRKLVGIALARS